MLDTLFGDSGYLQYYEDNTNFNYSYSINTTDYPTLHSHVDFCEQAGKHESNRESTRRLKAKKKPWNSLKIPRLWRRRRDSNPRGLPQTSFQEIDGISHFVPNTP